MKRLLSLPPTLPPRGLSRNEAAAYIGVGATKFDEMVNDGRMPQPKLIDGRRLWDRHKVDIAFGNLPGDEENDACGDLLNAPRGCGFSCDSTIHRLLELRPR